MLMLTFVKGLGGVVECELEDKLAGFSVIERQSGLFLIDFPGDVNKLLNLRSVEDIFFVIYKGSVQKKDFHTMTGLKDVVLQVSFDDAFKYHARLHGKSKHISYQVFAHLYGRWNFRRADLDKNVTQAIDQKFEHWKAVRANPKLEFDVRISKEGEVLLGLRLTDKFFSNRKYSVAGFEGSLKPTVAYALVYESRPRPDDVFLDPFCNAGTILIERSLVVPAKEIIGISQNKEALAAAQKNSIGQDNIEIRQGNFTELSFADKSISAIVTSHSFEELKILEDFLSEVARVLVPGGRLVILSPDEIENVLKNLTQLSLVTSKDIALLGKSTRVLVIKKSK